MAESPDTNEWFVKDERGVRGPLSESEMRRQVKQSSNPVLQVRQGNSDWHPADRIRNKLKQLADSGIYIKLDGTAEGPFTLSKAHELLQTISPKGIEVRTGAKGEWIAADIWLATVRDMQQRNERGLQSMSDALQNASARFAKKNIR